MVIMPSKSSLSIILFISASLSLAVIAIIPMYHEASAKKQCSNNGDSGGSSCPNKQDSKSNDDDHKHSSDDDNSAKKDKTPFVLAQPMPFP
jgi:hypothetical protein